MRGYGIMTWGNYPHLHDAISIEKFTRNTVIFFHTANKYWSYGLKYDKKPNANARHKILILNGI